MTQPEPVAYGHTNPPPGYAPCTREDGHPGPCAMATAPILNAGWSSQSYPAFEEARRHAYWPGDFILTHSSGFGGWLIRLGQGLRFRGNQKGYAQWNHCALIVSTEGDLVESLVRTGVTRTHIDKYKDVEYTLVRVYANPIDEAQVIRFADKMVGQEYGWLNDVSTAITCLTGFGVCVIFRDHPSCSAFLSRAQERLGAFFDRPATSIAPADLARYYSVSTDTKASA